MGIRSLGLGLLLLGTAGCDAAGSQADGIGEASRAAGARTPPTSVQSPAVLGAAVVGGVELGRQQRRPAADALDAAGRVIAGPRRAPIAWRAPRHWAPRRDKGKPYVLGEYGLPGHRDDRPALCRLIANASRSAGADAAEQADREVRRTRIRTAQGESMLSDLSVTVETIGARTWHVASVTGHFRPVLPFGKPNDLDDLTAGYAQLNLIPELPDVPFALRCWGPAEVIASQTPAIRSWAAAVQYPATG